MARISIKNRALGFKASILIFIIFAILGCSSAPITKSESVDTVQATFLGEIWNQGHAQASIISQDGGASYRVPGGSLWWFGDTFMGSRNKTGESHFDGGAVSCSVAQLGEPIHSLPPVLHFLTGRDGKVAQAIKFLPEEPWERYRIWPLNGIYVNHRSYIYFSLIELTGKKLWDFKSVGSGLAYSMQPLTVHKRIQNSNGWRFPVAPSAIVNTEDWLYFFDVEKRNQQNGVWLSRVRPANIENPDDYEFYCGPELKFTRDKSKQVLLLPNIYGQVSVTWNEYLKKYLLASSSDFSRPREIRFYSADNLPGPWNLDFAITVPEYRQGKKVEIAYCSYFHPELFRDNGRIMNLTFSLLLEKGGFDVNNEMMEVEINSKPSPQ